MAVMPPPIKSKFELGKAVTMYATQPHMAFCVNNEDVEYIRDEHGTTKRRILKPPYTMKFNNGKTTVPANIAELVSEISPPGTPEGVDPKKGDYWYGFKFLSAQDLAERFKKKEHKSFIKEMWRCWGIAGVHNTDVMSEFEFTEKIRDELVALKLLPELPKV